MKKSLITASMILLATGGAFIAVAGPLNPPAGPVASTFKTLGEVEPRIPLSLATTPGDADSVYRITQRGSYYVTGNVLGQAGKHGIEIAVSNVTLDLMGMELTGVTGSLDGVYVSAPAAQITIRNGSVSLWRQDGLDLAQANDCVIDGVRVAVNYAVGMKTGLSCIITNCVAQGNPDEGMLTGANNSLSNCTARNNGKEGIVLGAGGTAIACTASSNLHGMRVGPSAIATACTALSNTQAGFNVYAGGTASRCSANLNGQDGFTAGTGSSILECNATGNGNGAIGAGITLFGTSARIDGNHLTGNDYGIRTIGSDNIIIRNSARANPSGNFFNLLNENVGPVGSPSLAAPFGNISVN